MEDDRDNPKLMNFDTSKDSDDNEDQSYSDSLNKRLSRQDISIMRQTAYVKYNKFFDLDIYPETPEEELLSWTEFTCDFESKD